MSFCLFLYSLFPSEIQMAIHWGFLCVFVYQAEEKGKRGICWWAGANYIQIVQWWAILIKGKDMYEWIMTPQGVVEIFVSNHGIVYNTFDWKIVGARV